MSNMPLLASASRLFGYTLALILLITTISTLTLVSLGPPSASFRPLPDVISDSGKPEEAQSSFDLSIIILTYRAPDRVRDLILALEQSHKSVEWAVEILVVDNGCMQETALAVRLLQTSITKMRITLLKLCDNRAYSVANNIGVEASSRSSRWVLFLNDDVLPLQGFLEGFRSVVAAARLEGKRVGAVGGKLLFPNGNVIEAGSIVRSDGSTDNFYRYIQ